jgi:pectin methylesterase-like acyl-CoA thioesterase
MKSIAIAFLAVTLTACVSVPVQRSFPKVPAELMASCPPLQVMDPETTRLSDVVQSVVANYGQYQACDGKVDTWIEWYNTQKTIFDSVK